MSKDDLVYVCHMLDTARKIEAKTSSLTRGEFDDD